MDALSRIRVLPEELINQIAAGEVVENPASVVKELVENSIDAAATKVMVEVEGGGLDLIRVSDNGLGMSPVDAVMALRRHATSKISDLADLHAIRTLGFRGEALPAIASVCHFEMVTRRPEDEVGTFLVFNEGSIQHRPHPCAPGTVVTVRNLFYNVPARLKFQKGERSRNGAIRDVLSRIALAWPDRHFLLFQSGHKALDFGPCQNLSQRASQVLGLEADDLWDFALEGRVAVEGVLGSPSLSRPDPNRIITIVNQRPVLDPGIRRAVVAAYGPTLQEGRFPIAVIALSLPPEEVDVNVHPRKTEVRFRDSSLVYSAVFEAVSRVVSKTPWIKAVEPVASRTAYVSREDFTPSTPLLGGVRDPEASQPLLFTRAEKSFSGLRFLGQVARTVLVCEGPQALVLIDQHGAHERVLFDRLWKAIEVGEVPSEPLLFPEIVKLSPAEWAAVEEGANLLSQLGFDVELYSGDALLVRAVPMVLSGRSVAEAVRDLVASLTEDAKGERARDLRRAVATIACHSAVRAGDELTEEEVRALLEAMDGIDLAAYCPHGRQVVVVYPFETVFRWFGRHG